MFRWLRRRSEPTSAADAEWGRISARVRADKERRARALTGQEDLVGEVEAILFEHDLIGINFGENTDEYRAEAETITLRRAEARSVDDLRRIAHEEFVRWFDAQLAGPETRYQAVAEDIWRLWTRDAGSPDDKVG